MDHLASTHAALQELQVQRTLQRKEARASERAEKGQTCVRCGLIPRCCICLCLGQRPVPTRHAVTVVVHAIESARSSSTHPTIAQGLEHAEALVWNSAAAKDMPAIMERVALQTASSGRTPCFLYPAAHAIRVGTLYAGLPPDRRRAGLHLVALDGTWAK